MSEMSEEQNKILFFIKAPDHKLGGIETYFKKRNYTVYIESDLKESLVKIIETEPHYIFIAFDHPNNKIQGMPQIIHQSVLSQVIPYSQTNTKEILRILDYGGFQFKIYPPLSGPAIERIISKVEKAMDEVSLRKPLTTPRKKRSSMSAEEIMQIKSQAFANLDKIADSSEETEKKEKAKFDLTAVDKDPHSKKNNSGLIMQKGETKSADNNQPAYMPNQNIKQKSNLAGIIEEVNKARSETDDYENSGRKGKKTNSQVNSNSDLKNKNASTDSPIISQNKKTHTESVILEETESNSYCLLVQNQDWSGYLIIHSNEILSKNDLKDVFENWVKPKYPNHDKLNQNDFFSVKIDPKSFKKWSILNYELVTKYKNPNQEITIGTIQVGADELLVNIYEDSELLEVLLEIIPAEVELNLSLHLHLPENNKFLLYTPLHQKLSAAQKQRLLDRNVDKLFTPIEFESELKKLLIQKHLDRLLGELSQGRL